MKKRNAFLAITLQLFTISSLIGCKSNKSPNKQIYKDDDEKAVLSNPITVDCDLSKVVNPALIKKIDMYNAGCINPVSIYERDLALSKQLSPQSLRVDLSIAKHNGNGGMYTVSDEYDYFDFDEETETYKIDKNSLSYDFEEMEQLFSHIYQMGALPYASWDYIPFPLADNGKFNNLNSKVTNWQEVWEEIYYNYAKHFKDKGSKIGYHEIYNEPDLEILKLWGVLDKDDQYFLNVDDFAPNGDPSKGCYPDMYEYGVKGIRRADPDATVGGPAFALGEIGVEDWVGFLPRVKNKKLPIDFYSFHSYLDGETWFMSPESRSLNKKNELEKVVDGLQSDSHFLKTQLHINEYSPLSNDNGAKSGINAEFNYFSGASDTLSAVFEVVDRTSIQLINWAQLLSVNNVVNDPYGLVTNDGHPKAAYNAIQMYQDMPVWRYQSVPSRDDGVRAVVSSDDEKISVLLWNTNSGVDEDGIVSKEGDRAVDLRIKNPKFNTGTRKIYRVDKTHASYYDGTLTDGLSAQNVRTVDMEKDPSVWKGNIPGGGTVYLTINKDGAQDFRLPSENRFADDIKTEYLYEDRYRDLKGSREEYSDFSSGISGTYSQFDRKQWKMYLGMGDLAGDGEGRYLNEGVAAASVLAQDIPASFKIKVETDERMKRTTKYSAFGVRIDFFDDATETYADSVYLHNGIFYGGFNPNKQDPRMNDFPLFPWGTQAAASLDHEYQGNEWGVDLSQFAPEGWLNGQRRASISFEMRNVGPNARAAIQLIKN